MYRLLYDDGRLSNTYTRQYIDILAANSFLNPVAILHINKSEAAMLQEILDDLLSEIEGVTFSNAA